MSPYISASALNPSQIGSGLIPSKNLRPVSINSAPHQDEDTATSRLGSELENVIESPSKFQKLEVKAISEIIER